MSLFTNFFFGGAVGLAAMELYRQSTEESPERMGSLPALIPGASWAELRNPGPACHAWLVPVGLNATETKMLDLARTREDPYGPGKTLRKGPYEVHVVEANQHTLLPERLLVEGPGTYQLIRTRGPSGFQVRWGIALPSGADVPLVYDGRTKTWSVPTAAVLNPIPPPSQQESFAAVDRVRPTADILRPQDGAEMVRTILRESRKRPTVMVWSQPGCPLCESLEPILKEAAKLPGRRWVIVKGEDVAMEVGLTVEQIADGSPWITDRYPTVRRFENGRLAGEATDRIVDYWIESGDARDFARWVESDVSIADL